MLFSRMVTRLEMFTVGGFYVEAVAIRPCRSRSITLSVYDWPQDPEKGKQRKQSLALRGWLHIDDMIKLQCVEAPRLTEMLSN